MKSEGFNKVLFTVLLLVANVGIFIYFDAIHGGAGIRVLVDNFGLSSPAVLDQGEYYRFITSLFVHFDVYHLANNMLLLGLLGFNLEQEKGRIKFFIIYFVSGLGGNAVSFAVRLTLNQAVISGGASGAVFGLMGAVLGTYLKYKQPVGRLAGKGLLIMIGLSLYVGLTSGGVDNAAHIGGLIFGFLVAFLL